jgi:meso-butanediol dehydrogenase/(S,S)-butanediol dehydrogenase/diacetyl reductase
MKEFNGRTIVITGAGSGIGRVAALALAAEGAVVAAIDIDLAAAEETVRRLDTPGGVAIEADVSDWTQVEAAFRRIPFGAIDGLVNDAGIREVKSFQDLSPREWDRIVAVNLSGTFYCLKASHPRLRRPGGSIVNLSSVAGLVGVPKRVAYSATKHAIVGLTRALADDLGPDGIRVNAVCPGVIETPLTASYFGNASLVADLRRVTPLRRWGQPEEIAGLIVFLLSDRASFCTGAVFAADGGYTASKGFG